MPEDPRGLVVMSDEVALWLRIAMAKRPDDRFANALDMADAFEAAARGTLSPALRTRAQGLLGEQAWGTRRSATVPPEGATRFG